MAESNALQHLITRRRLLGAAGVGAFGSCKSELGRDDD